jgi:ABC-type transport system involved in multi-copper enzyme maturation permease subunit
MSVRLGPGPVFAYEWLTTTRRWQLYALRAGFVGVILAGMVLVWHSLERFSPPGKFISIEQLARYGERFYETVASIELTLVLLAAPALTAGAICLDKARGTLDHMLVTDLSNAEIVLGKLGVRLVPVLGLIACALPVAALGSLLGGIDPTALVGSFLTAIACACLGCSLALTFSVWGRKTHEVLMITYVILILWLASPALVGIVAVSFWRPPLGPASQFESLMEWLADTNPYYLAFVPYTNPGKIGLTTYLGFFGVCLCLSGLLLGLATHRIRTVAQQQAGQGAKRSEGRRLTLGAFRPTWLPQLPAPSLEGNPVLWREWHRSKPSRFLRTVWLLYSVLGVLWIALALRLIGHARIEPEFIGAMNMFQVNVGLLFLSVGAATSLAEERTRGSLDLLLSTPLSTGSILAGKWLGSFRRVAHVVVWPAATCALLAAESGRWISYLLSLGLILAYGAVITSLGLAMATWVSRLGRAVAGCVSVYVVLSIGWVLLIALLSNGPGFVTIAMIVGSPLYGTFFSTVSSASASHFPGNDELASIEVGVILWTLIHGLLAGLLFAATEATFDRCLSRVSETPGSAIERPLKKLSAGGGLDLDDWPAEDPAELLGPS